MKEHIMSEIFSKEQYDILDRFDNLELKRVEGGEELIPNDLNELFPFDSDEVKIGEKCCNFCAFLEYQNTAIDDEIKRLQELKKRNSKKVDNIKKFLLYNYNKTGLKNFQLRSINIRKSSSIEIDDNINIENIPEEFLNIKTVKTISKEKVKKYLDEVFVDGNSNEIMPNYLPWARINTNYNVTIK